MSDKWIEIDTAALKANLKAIESNLSPNASIIAVIKDEAYGHGMVESALFYETEGIDHFAVTWAAEGFKLRAAGIKSAILLLAPIDETEDLKRAIAEELTLTSGSPENLKRIAEAAAESGRTVKVHLKLETGLGRFGLVNKEEVKEAAAILKTAPQIFLEAVYTHFSEAPNEAFTKAQYAKFTELSEILKKEGISNFKMHCANSAAFLKYPAYHHDFVRLGTLLCGQYPVGNLPHPFALTEPYHYKVRINSVRTLPAGSCLGYKHTFRLKSTADVAVLPVGYSDGLNLTVNNPNGNLKDTFKRMLKTFLMELGVARFQPMAKINGRSYPIRGKVFMQMALVELPPHSGVKAGDIAEVPVSKTLAGKEILRIFV